MGDYRGYRLAIVHYPQHKKYARKPARKATAWYHEPCAPSRPFPSTYACRVWGYPGYFGDLKCCRCGQPLDMAPRPPKPDGGERVRKSA
jgi:hypothetical protein